VWPGRKARWLAVAGGHGEAAAVLAEAGENLEARPRDGSTALLEAARLSLERGNYFFAACQRAVSITVVLRRAL
jgi:hypothetical protein